MNRGVNRQQIFFGEADRLEFERLLASGHDRFGVEVHAYCLMTNHFHLLVHCPAANLSAFMHHVGSQYVGHLNERVGRDGPLFRGRYHAIPVDTDAYLMSAVRYIHRNPIDLGSPAQIDRYRWSSHRVYLRRRAEPPWMRTDTVLELFGDDRDRFDRFVRIDRVQGAGAGYGAVSALADLVIDERRLAGARQRLGRTVAVLLLDRVDAAQTGSLAAALGLTNDATRRTALQRARRRLALRPELAELVDGVRDLAA